MPLRDLPAASSLAGAFAERMRGAASLAINREPDVTSHTGNQYRYQPMGRHARGQGATPELIRRLVFATTDAPTYVDFPSGDAIQLEGYDGAVELHEDHPVVPRDLSIWEMGTDQKVKAKADSDYEKRTVAPPATARSSVVPADTTFVFAAPGVPADHSRATSDGSDEFRRIDQSNREMATAGPPPDYDAP